MKISNLLTAGVLVILFGLIVGAGFELYTRDTEPPTIANVHPVPLDATDIVPARGTFNPQHLTEEQRKLVLMGFADGVWSTVSVCDQLGVTSGIAGSAKLIAGALKIQEFDFTPDELKAAGMELRSLGMSRTAY